MRTRLCLSISLSLLAAGTSHAAAADFGKHVYAVLKRSCFECHGAERQEGGLRLDDRSDFLASETALPGDPDNSELLRRIALPAGHDELMPAIGDPLAAEEIRLIREWIKDGADWPKDFVPPQHWAYVPPVRPPVPELPDARTQTDSLAVANEIDAFIVRRLVDRGLSPAPPADRATLIRRVYLDLIGLPPTPEEVDAFLVDMSDDAWESLVDDLLQRPQFGERWARPWLDLARYADSHGFQRDNFREIWAYRDWVIRSLNADMPFDRFTIEQIAGDLLPNATIEQHIATGFHRCTPTNVEAGSLPEETRVEQVLDRVNTTAAVWLGTTLECAQCHDHKYDPFSQEEYYRLLAFFNNTEMEADRANPKSPSSIKFLGPSMTIANSAKDRQREKLSARKRELQELLNVRKNALSESLPVWAAALAEQAATAPTEHVLKISRFKSAEPDTSRTKLPDGSVLLLGEDPPDKDVYVIECSTELPDIAAIRLEALTHEKLPGGGPGRGDAVRRNFVLNAFELSVDGTAVRFEDATADFSQSGWPVKNLVTDGPGWAIAPQFGKSHWAQFRLPEKLPTGPKQLKFRLVQSYGAARTIGRVRLLAICGDLQQTPIPADVRELAQKAPADWSAAERDKLVAVRVAGDSQMQKIQQQISTIEKQIKAIEPDTTLVMKELLKARPAYVFDRGDYRKKGVAVQAGTPAVLHPLEDPQSNRLSLARWLIDPANPLTARVTVNRWWMEIFGRGIVATPEDFGVKGDHPTHPELLDWLALELIEHDWSMKHVLKKIVLSSTYRQSSRVTDLQRQQDPTNRWLSRGPRFRMSAEMIRDNALAISGVLSLKQFGPSIRPYQPAGVWSKVGGEAYDYKVSEGEDAYRRGIYVVLKRGAPYPSFVNFDATARLSCTVSRSRTNTPLQALTLLNDPVYVEAAAALAATMLHYDSRNDTARLSYGFRRAVARTPSDGELQLLQELLESERAAAVGEKSEEQPDFVRSHRPTGITPTEFDAWRATAAALLNLHETITRN